MSARITESRLKRQGIYPVTGNADPQAMLRELGADGLPPILVTSGNGEIRFIVKPPRENELYRFLSKQMQKAAAPAAAATEESAEPHGPSSFYATAAPEASGVSVAYTPNNKPALRKLSEIWRDIERLQDTPHEKELGVLRGQLADRGILFATSNDEALSAYGMFRDGSIRWQNRKREPLLMFKREGSPIILLVDDSSELHALAASALPLEVPESKPAALKPVADNDVTVSGTDGRSITFAPSTTSMNQLRRIFSQVDAIQKEHGL